MREVAIVAAVRTPIGIFGGSLKDFAPGRLGGIVLKEALDRAGVKVDTVEEVIMGNVLSAGHGQNVARQASMEAGIPVGVPSFTVNKVCGSGLKSVVLGAQAIMTGDADCILAGGVENMSQTPYAIRKARWGVRMGNDEMVDLMMYDGLMDIFNKCPMGDTAENVAAKYNITREDQDRFAMTSQNRAEAAIKEGRFKEETIPVTVPQRKGDPLIFDTDEHPRFGTTMESLARLRPVFNKEGTVTAGNASGINDGAAAVLLMSREKADADGIEPMAIIKSYASCGVPPEIMGIGPISASRKALEKADLGVEDLDLIEVNEAFAAQAIQVNREMGWDEAKVNVNGGGIALGHPIGASGTRLLVTLLHELKRRNGNYGLASLCIGGGQGIAMTVGR
ncbi:acetyl-CoA C-acetyltransferase [archaeon]|nr:acetyl-CoA C-acetyltransferase [archaeon]